MDVKQSSFSYTPKIPPEVLDREARSYEYQTQQEQNHFQDHIQYSHERFAEAVKGQHGSALLIGPGHCRDIPLQAMADFDQITLLDIDVACIRAFEAASLEAQVTFWQEDFTGRSGNLITEIYQTKEKPKLQQILHITSVLEEACAKPIKDPFPTEQYDFMAATVVLSQVNCLIDNAIEQVLPRKARAEVAKYGEAIEQKALQKMQYYLQKYALVQQVFLLDFMESRLKNDGTLFLSMTPLLTERKVDPQTHQALKQLKRPLINLPKIDEEIAQRFEQIGDRKVWQWTATKATEEMRWIERIFTVQTRILKQK